MHTGKSLSEALIFASTNPQYDDRLFIELQVQYMKIPSSEHGENMLCTEIVFDIQNNFCTQHVLSMFCKKKSFWQRFTCTNISSCMLYSYSMLMKFVKYLVVSDRSIWIILLRFVFTKSLVDIPRIALSSLSDTDLDEKVIMSFTWYFGSNKNFNRNDGIVITKPWVPFSR